MGMKWDTRRRRLASLMLVLTLMAHAGAQEQGEAEKARARAQAHARIAEINNDVVALYGAGRYAEAKARAAEALALAEQALGPEHPDTADSLNNLAALLQTLGDLPAARPIYERSLAIYGKTLAPNHPDTATALNNLALLLQAMGDLPAARSIYERALAIYEQALGPNHPGTARGLDNLAALLQALGETATARERFERAWVINRKNMHSLLPAQSSRERTEMVQRHGGQLALYLAAFAGDPAKTYAAALAWKGAALRAGIAASRLPPDASPEARRFAADLKDARARLARLVFAPPCPEARSAKGELELKPGEKSVAEQHDELTAQIGLLERKLTDQLPDFAVRALLDLTPADVAAALPADAALLEFLENNGNLHAWVVRKAGSTGAPPTAPVATSAPAPGGRGWS